ncbi:ABC transporter substrate-binding protein [Chloroflexi bacterium TSY]|nr:ABC transporter substrate-binding protein [Chloroflexi bacterium TSY]
MFTQKRFWSLVVLLMLCLVLAACTAAPTPGTVSPASDAPAEPLAEEELATSSPWINKCEGEPVDGGTVTLAFADQAMRGENWLSRSSTNQGFVFSQLVDLNIETLEIEPDVAESWEISEDGLTYTYHLRDDVLWHDGEQLMADDVKWTIEMFWHPDTNIPTRTTLPLFAIAGVDEFADGTTDEITGIQVLDDFTVEITLSEPRADFFYGMGGLNLFPKHIWEGMAFADMRESEFAREKIIGSGPFKMAEFEPDQFYILEAFEDYYQGRPHLDRLIFRIGLTSVASWLPGLEAGEIQVGNMVNGLDRERVEENPDLTVVGAPLPGAMSIWPNHSRFEDKRVLQAMVHAIDRTAIAESIYGPGQALAYEYANVDPKGDWISPDIPTYNYDPEKAKQLLEEAGWDGSQELNFITYYQSELDRSVVAAMQQFWAEVGINVSVEHMDGPTFVARFYEEPDFDLGYGCCGVALPFEYPRYSCENLPPAGYNGSQYCNDEIDEMVSASLVEPDAEKRKQMWYEISEVTNDQLLHMTLFQQDRRHAISANVCNYQFRQWTNIVWPERNPHTWWLAQ